MEKDKKNWKIYAALPFLLAVVLILGILLGARFFSVSIWDKNAYKTDTPRYDKINDIIRFIETDYVDSVSDTELKEEAIRGMLKKLDPHSQYISADEFQEVNEPLEGNFEGIGIEFRIVKDTINVIHVIAGGPSEKVGLKSGDRIVWIDDSLVGGIDIKNTDAVKMLKGPRGTRVKVGVMRPASKEKQIDFVITRDIIPIYSLDVAYMVDSTIGYIKINKFSATTTDEFNDAMKSLNNEGMKKLILDLRGNVGGYLKPAINLADAFLKKNKLIVYTQGKNRPKQFAYATRSGRFEDQEVVILIDEGSASASEILAGAIQDNDRGTIIGRRSFGKGLVQEQLELNDGSALRLTVARYYSPTGRCIQKPYDKDFEAYHKEYFERFSNGEVFHKDSIHFPDSLKYTTPGGKIVYGGGGIMPDIFIPVRTGEEYVYYNKLINRGLIYQFAFDYSDKRRSELIEKYKNADSFIDKFSINKRLFNELISYAEDEGVDKDENSLEIMQERIKTLLKAYIGRNLYNNEAFYPIYNNSDKTVIKAIEELNSN